MAVRNKIDAIPALIVVNRAGKVVSLTARGEKLVKRVADLVEEKAPKTR